MQQRGLFSIFPLNKLSKQFVLLVNVEFTRIAGDFSNGSRGDFSILHESGNCFLRKRDSLQSTKSWGLRTASQLESVRKQNISSIPIKAFTEK